MGHLTRLIALCFVFHTTVAAQATYLELNDGNRIPTLALGTGRGTAKKDDSLDLIRQAVYWAIEAGYRHIDTATLYGDEEQVGQGIAEAIRDGLVTRQDLYITTKIWNDKHARDKVVPELNASLKRLKLDYVDLYLIHFPISTKTDGSPDNIDYLETWQGMEEAKSLNLTKSIGVSNFNITQIDRLLANSKIRPAINQFEVNPTLTQEPLVNHCRNLGIQVMAYSPFGFLVSRKSPDAPPPKYDDPIINDMARKYGKTPGQIVLRYLVDRGLIPIPKSTNKNRIAENIDIFNFQLTSNEVATINKFNKNKRVIHPIGWEDYPNYPYERV
ncbi:hypothetical protein K1T71_011407 [Dendrolimus kikuchii]|uniref:Uncharacterized protein n=1 Tax=Dendrolimus kikuchii TaxID=765133 RepID=A0ACC1CNX0_9NEOP|nr:hypothetical protein K1T71_011407 [Dendrolimus kikuchii]